MSGLSVAEQAQLLCTSHAIHVWDASEGARSCDVRVLAYLTTPECQQALVGDIPGNRVAPQMNWPETPAATAHSLGAPHLPQGLSLGSSWCKGVSPLHSMATFIEAPNGHRLLSAHPT